MLVLSRQKNEAIMIGDDVEIVVVDIRGDRVRLGINAPHSVSVHRKEIYEAIRHENIEASRADVVDLSELGDMLSKAGTAGEIGGEQIEKEGEIKRREQEKEDADENTQA